MNAPMTPARLAEIRSSVEHAPEWSAFLSEIDRRDLLAEVDRLQAVDHRCPSDHWPGRRRQQCHHWLGHDGNHANRFYRWSDEDRYPPPTSGDQVQP